MSDERTYIAIDLKSFYASVECVERGLDPLTTNLVVADESRTEKTICLAVSPSLKSFGIPGRARLFEAVAKVKEANAIRRNRIKGKAFTGSSYSSEELNNDPYLAIDFIRAVPRMAYYMEYSRRIYDIYLQYVAPEDIHVYSVDEVFMDITDYHRVHSMEPAALAKKILKHVLKETGITATVGIGTNMYLAKIAMDVYAKHIPGDEDGARIAILDERTYREKLWSHRPITDFWRVGRGYAKRLYAHGLYTMGDIARCSLGKEDEYYNEELLYRLFGVNAELLIDHAWGYEPCLISDIKAYRPESKSISQGQVLSVPYTNEKARIIVKEMTDILSLDLVRKGLLTDQLVLTVGYDIENLTDPVRRKNYHGEIKADYYGRQVPKSAHGTINLDSHTSSSDTIIKKMTELYDRITDPSLLVRRMYVVANHILTGDEYEKSRSMNYEQLSIFDIMPQKDASPAPRIDEEKEKRLQHAVLDIKERFGKNAVLKGMNFEEGATTRERNAQIGGHRS